ncbi:geranylgeranyl diphosphate synthase type II [Keratinibaculum paraultunense]|uniref:Farnesyl diphosphate synthase n=1 Tax=Keratinibaculum paraultunense TaxID=1278232 RepID=A0A4R3L2B2_9FIRM|nr:farnesyl diphosphate synthase [Keratinibaculum paraultunense]QQY80619.1 polyprenyl synthetase family protein [Keratinibaculum paraultunense]TCS91351.1 geranylgeranyl diphosphate synthase type II [Keratinibaculum paraultunense]
MTLAKKLNELKNIIDTELEKIFYGKIGYQEIIFDSIKYSLFTGGKRVRPILLIESCRMFSDEYENAIPFSLAIEMIHTYSLIHDDLPSMDNDDFRRGKPTNHKVFGEAIAILAGDGLLNLAFETMLDHTLKHSKNVNDYMKYTKAMKEIGNYSGIYGMIGGQVIDLISSEIPMDEDKLIFMYKCKTAALIQASVVAGTILGGGNNKDIEHMRKYGLYLGLAYQIKDDILDMKEDSEIKKLTYLSYHDVDYAKSKVIDFSKKAIDILNKFADNKDISFLVEFTKELTGRKY